MTEPLVLISLFSMPGSAAETFVEAWPTRTGPVARAPGFRGARLHRAVFSGNPYPVIEVAEWDSSRQWEAAVAGLPPQEGGRRTGTDHSAFYRVVSVTPDPLATHGGDETFTLINLFTMPAHVADAFVEGWPASTAPLAHAPGFRGTRLHRAVSPGSPYRVVNIAQWDSPQQWQAALSGFRPGGERRRQAETGGIAAQPAFYRVVSVIPGPLVTRSGT